MKTLFVDDKGGEDVTNKCYADYIIQGEHIYRGSNIQGTIPLLCQVVINQKGGEC